jgi:hypothetical protein
MCLPSASVVWLSNELLARRDLAVVWLERGTRARRSEIRSAHRGLVGRDQGGRSEIPEWLDLDKVVPTKILEAMHELAEDVQALKCKIADLGQTGSELELEYERYLDKAFASVPDEAREGLRGLVDVASGYCRFHASFLTVSVPLSAWTDDDPSWPAEQGHVRWARRETRLGPVR